MTVGSITYQAAQGWGDLDGYLFECDRCSERAAFSFRSMTADHQRRHGEWHDRQESLPRRKRSKAIR